MKVIGLTGLIGTGKTTVSNYFAKKGFLVFNSDNCVGNLTKYNQNVIRLIAENFNGVVVDGIVDKIKLKQILFKDYEKNIAILESIYHPFVKIEIQKFIKKYRFLFWKDIVLEVPLLFEAQIDNLCDYTLLVVCSKENQIKRVKKRGPIKEEDLEKIMKKQGNVQEKCKKVDFIIDTDETLDYVELQVDNLIKEINSKKLFGIF
jgi:dephospho-CoA kinase